MSYQDSSMLVVFVGGLPLFGVVVLALTGANVSPLQVYVLGGVGLFLMSFAVGRVVSQIVRGSPRATSLVPTERPLLLIEKPPVPHAPPQLQTRPVQPALDEPFPVSYAVLGAGVIVGLVVVLLMSNGAL